MKPAVFCWSGGKDSAFSLYKVLIEGKYQVKYLLTTLSEDFQRISMHGVRRELLQEQALSLGIPLLEVFVSQNDNSNYENQMRKCLLKVKSEGISDVIFGDIFLEDLRHYRENNLKQVEMNAVFPIWNYPTNQLICDFEDAGFKSQICCTSETSLGKKWLGKSINKEMLNVLPAKVDPCGENGEYHSFCYDGPIFKYPIHFFKGETVFRSLELKTDDPLNGQIEEGFWYLDLIAASKIES